MKSLFFICLLVVLYGMAVSLTREYIYISEKVSMSTAQTYCEQLYGDLASITTEEEHQEAVKVTGDNNILTWIGLERTVPHANIWKWSDGEEPSFLKWNSGEPDDRSPGENCVVMNQNGWFDTSCDGSFSFICNRVPMLVKEKKTWEEALKHCRTHYTDLAFMDTETLLDLLKIDTEQAQTASVWTGLRFLDGKWFWVNRMLLESLVSLPSCPVQPYRCGAYNFNTYVLVNTDCNEELNFLCYN